MSDSRLTPKPLTNKHEEYPEHQWRKTESGDDWTKVPVDTKIWVKNSHDPIWIPRHFAEYKHGKVHAWLQGKTSFTTSEKRSWECAKLKEDY